MAAVFSPPSLYEVLKIPVGATNQEIKSAYRRLARTFHPDVRRETDVDGNEFIRIHAAYSTLSNPDKRAVYDRTMFVARGGSPVFDIAELLRCRQVRVPSAVGGRPTSAGEAANIM